MHVAEVDLHKENLALREELKRARSELRRVDETKRDFIALAAHELRSPLAILLGYAKILETEVSGNARERAEIIASYAWQLKSIVDAMITLQQLDSGEFALRLETVEVASVIQNVVDSRQRDISEKELTVRVLAEPDVLVRADRERLALVIANLLSNSIKYSPHAGTITIRARAEASRTVVSIEDQGIGIPPDQQPRIFERFYQVGESMTRRYGGLGLGLAVAKMLVELHDGQIWVESSVNQGSTFSFSLPRVIRGNGHKPAAGSPSAMVL